MYEEAAMVMRAIMVNIAVKSPLTRPCLLASASSTSENSLTCAVVSAVSSKKIRQAIGDFHKPAELTPAVQRYIDEHWLYHVIQDKDEA